MSSVLDNQRVVFQRGLAASSISNKGFADVSVIEGDREALGHGIYIDDVGLGQLMGLLMGKSLPGYVTHDGAMFEDRLTKEIGMFSGFYRDGDKIKAKTFSFFDSFREHNKEEFDKLVELADKMPEQMGVSIVFAGTAVWIDGEGEEVPGYMPEPDGAMYGMPVVRFASVESADFVKNPAANSGLFSIRKVEEGEQVDANAQSMETTTVTLDAHKEALSAKDAELETIKGALAEKEAEVIELAELHAADLEDLKTAHEEAFSSAAEELEAAKTKAEELERFDSRKLGATAAEVVPEKADPVPAPAATDQGKWQQYAELLESDKDAAADFKAKYLSNRFRTVSL